MRGRPRSLTTDQVRRVLTLNHKGLHAKAIAVEMGVHSDTIKRYIRMNNQTPVSSGRRGPNGLDKHVRALIRWSASRPRLTPAIIASELGISIPTVYKYRRME